ncbi:adhesion G protein-coupled receptor E1-like [Hyla sarda]|uniref:adhesion G protein-coupled receptor E1-like n=1 Tax=Hyla sarda TaxID=327740 RepID=UPI0024C21639|nr:adhesion G protein-coupled receptor E1-like [Hyla sarda]
MKEFGMDQRFPTHLLLLILGLTVFSMAQQDAIQCVKEDELLEGKHECSGNWICPSNVSCHQTTCRCKKGYYPCQKKNARYCRDLNECNKNHGCGKGATCKNTLGSYYCECDKQNSTKFCPNKNTENYCEAEVLPPQTTTSPPDSKVKDKCDFNSSELKEKEKCDRMNPPDAICSLLQTAFARFNSSCHSNTNVTKEEAKEQLQQVTKHLSDKLDELDKTYIDSTENRTEIGQIATNILNFVETIMLKSFIDTPRNQIVITPKLSVSMKASHNICTSGVLFFSLTVNDSLMEFPCPQGDTGPSDGAVFIVYQDFESTFNEVSEDYEINTRVVTGAITRNLTSQVTFTLAHIQTFQNSKVPTCVFWDPKKNDWSTDGCTTEYSKSNDTHTTCSCNHLSSFAVIIAPFGHEDNLGLTIVSQIGLSLSVVCLVLSLLTLNLCRSLRSAHTSVLTTMCSCLFLGQVLFLVGLHQTSCRVLCSIIAGGLHFLFLCAFCWMSIESVLLFMTVRNLRAVNYLTSRRSNFPVMCLLGFGVPSVIVGISAAIQPDGYGTDNYCWLKPKSTIWSFLGPVAVIVITNTTLLVFTVLLLRIKLANLNTNVSTLKNNRILTFKALAQLFILGCTWGIGFFQFHGSGSLVIAYIFIICNSLQGVYIFLVHCIFNNQVRQEYRKLFRKAWKRDKQSSDEATPHTGSRTINLTEITKPAICEQSSEAESKVNWQ